MMRTQSSLLALFALIAPFVSADLHSDGVCVDVVGGQNVYNEVATTAACTAYLNRNTGGEQWDTCPDCTMKVIGNLNVCHSDAWHIGGDELEYYCKENGAGRAMSS